MNTITLTLLDIAGKTTLVTGGARRVGKAITPALAREGADVVINYYDSAGQAKETAVQARSLGVGALPVQADVSDLDQVNPMMVAACDRFGRVDILVNSASLWRATPFPTKDVGNWRRVIRILIDRSFYCANAVAPMMLEHGEGTIVNIVDLSAWMPFHGYVAHSVGKAALLALTRQLAVELGPAVRVNAIASGPVLPPPDCSDARIASTIRRTLFNRWGAPDDVAETAVFLVHSSYITGEVIVVDGGARLGFSKPNFR